MDPSGSELLASRVIPTNDRDDSAWCPDSCPDCVLPTVGKYRFPPNTCVDYGDGCAECPVVELASSCLACPASTSTALDNHVGNEGALNATAHSGCQQNYTGVLCRACDGGFTRAGDDGCEACWEAVWVRLAMFGMAVLGAVVIAYFVRSTIASEGKPSSENIMMLKQVVSHMQVVGM